MVELLKDKKSSMWVITRTDDEGFHRQLNLTEEELDDLVEIWTKRIYTDRLGKA